MSKQTNKPVCRVCSKKVRKINSKDKGDRYERKIGRMLSTAWGVTAYRTPGSGAYTSNKRVGKKLKDAAAGDVVVEEIPGLYIECKNYLTFLWSEMFKAKWDTSSIRYFYSKANKEARDLGKTPLLICKEKGCPDVVVVDKRLYLTYLDVVGSTSKLMTLRLINYTLYVFPLSDLLALDKEQIIYILNIRIQNEKSKKQGKRQ